jgi:hypothetical protein
MQMVGSFVLSQTIRRILEQDTPDLVRARELVEEARREGIALDDTTVSHAAVGALARFASGGAHPMDDEAHLRSMLELARFAQSLPMTVDPWPLQEAALERLRARAAEARARDPSKDPEARSWLSVYDELCADIGVVP